MKIFKFPGGRITNLDKDHNNKSPKLSQFKKYGSLDLTYFFTNKNKQLQRVYRANSCDKKVRNKSSNSTKSTNELKHQFKPYQTNYKIKNPKKELTHPEKKIFLQTEKKGKYLYNDMKFSIQLLNQRLARCLEIKSQKIFTEQYKQAINLSTSAENKQNNEYILCSFIQKLGLCEQRKIENKLQIHLDKISMIEKQKISLGVEIKRMKIKQQTQNCQIKKLNDLMMAMSKELKKCKEKSVVSEFTQTQKQNCQILIQDYENKGQFNQDFSKLIQQLRVLKEKQNHMSILVGQLRRDGLNLQKIYNKGLRFLKNSENNEQEESSVQQFYQEKKRTKHSPQTHKIHIKNKHDSDADDSIIDQIDALSFNYDNKEQVMEVYSPRRVYVCQKKMDENLKKQLELNFQCLYEENEQDYGTKYNSYNSEGCPTI